MQRYIAVRLSQGLLVLFIVSILVFVMSRASGDPVVLMLPADATKEQEQAVRESLGLDRSYPEQYWLFISSAVRGDLGESLRIKVPVTQLFWERFPNTLQLIVLAMALAVLIGIPLGVFAAVRRGRLLDRGATIVAVAGMALPSFWLGLMLVYLFSVNLGWLPVAGMDGPANYVLPVVTLGVIFVAAFERLQRSTMLEVLDAEYIKLARIKGLPEATVIWKHGVRNALVPVLALGGVWMGLLVQGAIVVETVFAWPGVGRLLYQAVVWRDYPLVQGLVLLNAAFVLLINLAVDIAQVYLDPRVRQI